MTPFGVVILISYISTAVSAIVALTLQISNGFMPDGVAKWFVFSVFTSGILSIIARFLNKNNKEKTKMLNNTISPYSYQIKPFADEIDRFFGDEKNRKVAKEIKDYLMNSLVAAEKNGGEKFVAFIRSADKRQWVFAQVSSRIFDLIATGQYHIYDQLTPEGMFLKSQYRIALERAFTYGYIDLELYEHQIKEFDKQVAETGKWA